MGKRSPQEVVERVAKRIFDQHQAWGKNTTMREAQRQAQEVAERSAAEKRDGKERSVAKDLPALPDGLTEK